MSPAIIEIDNILVSSDIFTEHFACDYPKCKGCCCIIGDSGAPLEESECGELKSNFEKYKSYMSEQGLLSIKSQGLWVTDSDGDLVTPLIDGKECAFTYFDENDNCMCAIEKSWFDDGESKFKKPISCWLYPIRVSKLSNGMTALNLHQWHICIDAYVKGKKEGIPAFRFLKEPLTFLFGEEFYLKLEEIYKELN